MNKIIIILLLVLQAGFAYSQEEEENDEGMNNERMGEIINEITEEVEGQSGNWQFVIDSTIFICLTDENHNRMRVISPVLEVSSMTQEQMLKCMEANFHTMLDSNYAVSDGILWSTYIHPLRELTPAQFLSAISQVYSGVKTFGTDYSSGLLSFPKSDREIEEEEKKKNIKKI